MRAALARPAAAPLGLASLLLAVALAGCAQPAPPAQPPGPAAPAAHRGLPLAFGAPVDLKAVGYEPGIAVDQLGTVYVTAHKVLDRPETWPYLGSWFLVSRDNGTTWGPPGAPAGLPVNAAQQFLGDEGDIGIDARGWAYFVDTYLADNDLHAWSDRGQTWQGSSPVQKTTGLDDRPWIAAQGRGVLHYLGNNGNSTGTGSRIWYYRSTDAGTTWSEGTMIPGDGWMTISADNSAQGKDVYIAQEAGGANAPGGIAVRASHDQGATWGEPVAAGNRTGPGRAYPVVSAAPGGVAWVLWMDCGSAQNCADNGGGRQADKLFVARSTDAGRSWQSWDVTPKTGLYLDYPTLAAGPNGTVAIAFYATRDLPVGKDSAWQLYAAMDRALNGTPSFDYALAANDTVYRGADLHALHDFFEIAIGPDEALHIAYMHSEDSTDPAHDYGTRTLWYVRGAAAGGALPGNGTAGNGTAGNGTLPRLPGLTG